MSPGAPAPPPVPAAPAPARDAAGVPAPSAPAAARPASSARDAAGAPATRRSPGPLIVDVKLNALDDGPGVRTVVFFKGCPLRCVWCQNPEALSSGPQLQRDPERCLGCGACVAACPERVARPGPEPQAPGRCRVCGACTAACPPAARRVVGTAYTVADLAALASRDLVFYRRSGGGVTLSGGEPTLYPAFAGALAAALRERGIHVLLETCGHFGWAAFARHLLGRVATVYFDLKLADPAAHRAHTGRDNALILGNLERLVRAGVEVLPRVPLVPGITDGAENLRALAARVRAAGLGRVALLPYNPLWLGKRRALGLPLPYAHAEWMPAAAVERARAVVRGEGLEVAE